MGGGGGCWGGGTGVGARLVPPSRSSRPNRSIAGAGAEGADAGAAAAEEEQDGFRTGIKSSNRIDSASESGKGTESK